MKLFLSIFCATLLTATPSPAAGNPDWIRGSGGNLELRLAGNLSRQSGGPVEDASVTVTLRNNHEELDFPAKVEGDRYKVWLPVNRNQFHTIRIAATHANSEEANISWMRCPELHKAVVDGHDLVWVDGLATQIVAPMPKRTRVFGKLTGEQVAGLAVTANRFRATKRYRSNCL